jgi:hypothetical protein
MSDGGEREHDRLGTASQSSETQGDDLVIYTHLTCTYGRSMEKLEVKRISP